MRLLHHAECAAVTGAPFDQVNARLQFDRERAAGFHLDVPAGSSERWAPGETRTVRLVRYTGGT
jgi:urease beta subunit